MPQTRLGARAALHQLASKLLLFALFAGVFGTAQAQNAPRIYNYGTSLAGVPCDPTQSALWIIRSGGSAGVYRCSATNTFTLLAGTFFGGTLTSPLLLPDGTAAAPSLAFSSDADGTGTGLFRSAANSIGFSTNGTERWTINSSGAFNCTTDGGCDIGNGSADPRDLSLKRNLKLRGSTSGTVTVGTAAIAGTWTFTLPANDGDANQVLKTDGNGATSWTTPSGGASCLVYTALLTQSGTDAPVATVLQNTLGGTVVWTRESIGEYRGKLENVFTENKTFITPRNQSSVAANYEIIMTWGAIDRVFVFTTDNSPANVDDILFAHPIEIRVCP